MNLGCSGVNEPMGLVVGSGRSKGAGGGYLPWGQRTQQSNLSFTLCFSSQLNQTLGWKECWSLNVCLPLPPSPAAGGLYVRDGGGGLTEDPEVPARQVWAPPPSSSTPLSLAGMCRGFPLSPHNMELFSWQQQILGSLAWFGICFPKLEGGK